MYRPRESREPTASSDWQKVWFLAHEALVMTFESARQQALLQAAACRQPSTDDGASLAGES